jgi:Flp pilus assembly pilin Flp
MIAYLKTWLGLRTIRRAMTALEYALIAGLLALAVLTASSTLGGSIDDAFSNLANLL